jgi:hypothetical protein
MVNRDPNKHDFPMKALEIMVFCFDSAFEIKDNSQIHFVALRWDFVDLLFKNKKDR